MKTEELLKPRFKLIADYPGNTQEIGNVTVEVSTANYFRKYPANFRELQWWEDREIEDMPEYVKFKSDSNTGKVLDAIINSTGGIAIQTDCISQPDNRPIINYCPIGWFLPASESEYLNYINSNLK